MKMLWLLSLPVNRFRFYRLTIFSKPKMSFAGATQANDLPPIRDIDSTAVVAAKRRIQELIEEWLERV